MNYTARKKKLLKILASKSLDAFIVKKKENILYLTGAKKENALLFVSGKKTTLIPKSNKSIKDASKKIHSKRIGIESNNSSYVESLRMIKDDNEIKCIRAACKDADQIMSYALKNTKISIKENALKNKLETYLIKKGIKKAGFDIITASGKNASMPHACSSEKKIKKGDMVVIDLGTMNYGYNSDLTRTVFLGRINRKYSRIYNIVLDAQKKAIKSIRPGVSADYIDNISRQYIIDKGLGKYFIHGLGHGIGLQVHESPRISKNNSTILKKNMVITIEPGIYIPGWGGVRIEDVVLITKNGSEVLTKSNKKLLCR